MVSKSRAGFRFLGPWPSAGFQLGDGAAACDGDGQNGDLEHVGVLLAEHGDDLANVVPMSQTRTDQHDPCLHESVARHRALADAYQPDLATSLSILADFLPEESGAAESVAAESSRIYRELGG
jgi:hypothetical protein